MAQHILRQVWSALSTLNPNDVRAMAGQGVLVGLHGRDENGFAGMEEFFCPPELSRERRLELLDHLLRAGELKAPARFDLEIYEEGMPRPNGTFAFYWRDPMRTVELILESRDSLALPLARLFPPFRKPVAERIIHRVSKENALFAMATALPDIIPSLVELPWAVGQFASDTAFLTVNQIRMAFLLAAASDREVGYGNQRAEIGSIVAGAFGWRAIAREMVGKVPFGGGLIPKAAVAYAGTYVAGKALERWYREGYSVSRHERKHAYQSALDKGKRVAAELLAGLRQRSEA
ncbi:MAG: hypothetical protein HY235_11855 [Acidobacteria bacterium]|nr:hypothetical protein [Acidobacteriota bacterium]